MKAFWIFALLPHFAFAAEMINGTWKGTYSYEDGRPPVSFELELCQESSRIRGSVAEPASTGGAELGARVEGSVAQGTLTFRKTYDGRGGLSHSVEYEGAAANGRMSGKWRIGTEVSGPFEIERVAGSEKDAGCVEQPVMVLKAL
jgi:hypothetical protein